MANTGKKIVLTLKEVVATGHPNAGNPTGQTKQNTTSDPDYIAPSQDLTTCPITSGATCPVVYGGKVGADKLEYEFNIPTPVMGNAAIVRIEVFVLKAGVPQGSAEYAMPRIGYVNGTFSSLTAGTYTLDVIYFNSSSQSVAACSNALTVTI